MRGSGVNRAGRRTNLALLGLALIATASGSVAFGIGEPWVRWVVMLHAIAGLGIVGLVPRKAGIVARGVRLHRSGSTPALVLATLVAIVVISGFAHAAGLAVSVGPVSAMQIHVGAALACIPLMGWHVVARRTRPRAADLSRRNLLRAGVVAGGAAATYGAIEVAIHLAALPGAGRRATGSYERGSHVPRLMPITQWLNDRVPGVSTDRWALTLIDAAGERRVGYADLIAHDHRMRAVIDCTGGWWAEQAWEGALLTELLVGLDSASSIEVSSITGYGRRLPAADAGRLLLAHRVAGAPLSAGHGFPARLVAPGRRGFWWVKWVDRIALSDVPWWWQAPFPTA
jgi:DMSO/TMAO reductase YedYZ molybdopterin-dependent catalytic subunit